MEKVLDFLKKNKVMTIATCADNKPRASIMEYYVVNDSIVFATSPSSIKSENLKENDRISVSVYAMPQFVTLDGSVTEPSPAEIKEFTDILQTNHPEFKELVEKGMLEPFVYYKVVIDTAYYNDFSKGMTPAEIFKA